jgi:hypothetical protein
MDDVTREPDPSPPVPSPPVDDVDERPAWRRRLWLRMRPRLRQTWLNVRVWLPFLMNPFDRKRLIRYTSKENRVGLSWDIELPVICWQCGQDHGLRRRKFSTDLRSFEYPIGVVAGTMLGLLLVAMAAWCMPHALISAGLAAAVVLLGVVVIWLKSWREHVDLQMWGCEEHRKQAVQPEMAAYDEELYVYLPTIELTKAALKEQKDRRRGNREAAADDDL